MKKSTKIICMLALGISMLSSCKNKEAETTDAGNATPEQAQIATVPDTTNNPNVVNDTAVGGVTSGKMEQVP